MAKYLFFSGKGGVGKTTMASATAVHYAMKGRKTLIVTTDPASNLADVFEQEIGHKVTRIMCTENLFAMEIDPDAATREYKEGIIGPFREIMPADVIASMEENLSGPCTTEMASFDRFIDFMEDDEFDIVVFDTAPTGHTIRLLELPVDWSRHIEEASKGSGQTCLGPVSSIQDSKEKYDRATAILRDQQLTRFIFVMRPEELSLYETLRASKELETIGIKSGEIIINGILPESVCDTGFFREKFDRQQDVIRKTDMDIHNPTRYMLLRDNEVKGLDALRKVADELFHGKTQETDGGSGVQEAEELVIARPDIDALFMPDGGTKALFFTGKGGVGKTTVSCIMALYMAEKGFKTLIVTTDPAAHLGEVFDVPVGTHPTLITDNLHAVMIDQVEAFNEYKNRVLDEARGKYSDDMVATMEEELNSPCTEEMAAFDKFIRFIEGKEYDVVVFDTAPTGHTLRLLELPFDYEKQAEMMVAGAESAQVKEATENRFKNIIQTLRSASTVFSLVLYPESTPILESYRAMLDLKDAGIETSLVIANMVLPSEACSNAFLVNRKNMQTRYLKEIQEKFKLPVLQFPMMRDEIKGLDNLNEALDTLQN